MGRKKDIKNWRDGLGDLKVISEELRGFNFGLFG
jgi:hypothetical protein